jgi:hypothetical protein
MLPMTEQHISSIADRFEWLLRVARERRSRHELAVAAVLAACVNSRTGTAWPSARTIAEAVGLDLRHAWAALRRLRDAGFVHVAEPGGPARSATYTLVSNEDAGGRGHRLAGVRQSPPVFRQSPPVLRQSAASHVDATQRRTWMQRSVARGCNAASHVGATEHGANAERKRSERGGRAPARARSASAPRAARAARADFAAVNRAALARLPEVLARLLPGGRVFGEEWRAGPLRVQLRGERAGCWCDFATGDTGGDPVSLAAAVARVPQAEAAQRLAGMLGICGDG